MKRILLIAGAVLLCVILSLGVNFNIHSEQVQPETEREAQEIEPLKEVRVIYPPEEIEEKSTEEIKESEPEPEKIYYSIPDKYEKADLTRELQEYIYEECNKRDLDYSKVLALIERESGYYSLCSGDNGNSKGYMQVYEKYHRDIMEAEGVTDLYEPKGNIRVGLDILQSLYKRYGNSGDHCVLMVYNMGSGTANKLWKQEIYSTEYTREIINRAKEIEQDLTQD